MDFTQLITLMKRLRAPDGCPWDREQTVASLTPYLLEECHELLEALASGEKAHVCEEMGDLLFQIVFLAELFSEEGSFTISDVIEQLHAKMVRRHPHVFGDVVAKDSAAVLSNWEKIKAGEKQKHSVLDGVPRALPALSRSLALQRKAARVGFDWDKESDVLDKVHEELHELEEARDYAETQDEFGDLLFALVNYARRKEIDPEFALTGTIQKFISRFGYIERSLAACGKKPEDQSLDELDALWCEAKRAEWTKL
ncbi:MAG: nucleoside triphosphate pyrophosphohydrolase [Spirochaetota bacterium]|jgi:MazG family protein|nr:nucleoside triphosphate pyrophosphohydrolase [Spirochaetota bacterium]